MKKFLSLIGSLSLTATIGISVISCATPTNLTENQINLANEINSIANRHQKEFVDVSTIVKIFNDELHAWTSSLEDKSVVKVELNEGEVPSFAPEKQDQILIGKINADILTDNHGNEKDQAELTINVYYAKDDNKTWTAKKIIKNYNLYKGDN